MLTGEMLTAAEASQFGLLERVCSPESLIEETNTLARKIAVHGPLTVKTCKKTIHAGMELPSPDALKLELEAYDP